MAPQTICQTNGLSESSGTGSPRVYSQGEEGTTGGSLEEEAR